jgi:hypothetical protein
MDGFSALVDVWHHECLILRIAHCVLDRSLDNARLRRAIDDTIVGQSICGNGIDFF